MRLKKLAIVEQFLQEDCNVVIVGTRELSDYKEVEELVATHEHVLYVKGNISKQQDRKQILAKTLERFQHVDILVNNAGVAPLNRCDLLEMTEESFDRVVGINTKGTMFMSQLIAKQMILQQPLEGSSSATFQEKKVQSLICHLVLLLSHQPQEANTASQKQESVC